MTDYSTTITNSINVLGGSPPSLWGVAVWGVDNWGVTEELTTTTTKILGESVSLSDTFIRPGIEKVLGESLSVASESTLENLLNSAGYYYVFTGGVTDAENRSQTTYTEGSDASTIYSSVAGSSTDWSDA